MSKIDNSSRISQIIQLLESVGHSLNIDEIAKTLHIPVAKVRNVITPYQAKVVKVGRKNFDLAGRVYKGRVFRYTPTTLDITHNGLHYNADIFFLLYGYQGEYSDPIHISSDYGNFELKRSTGRYHDYLLGLKDFYRNSPFQPGDDLIFICLDLESKKYSMRLEPANKRKNEDILVKNTQLCDFIYQLLLYESNHYADTLFLIRKYAFEFDGFTVPAPDMLLRAIETDNRFIHNQRDSIYSWNGAPLSEKDRLDESVVIGIRKYYLLSRDEHFYPISIQNNDEFNIKEAWCTHCYRRAKWQSDHWSHIYSHDDIFDCEVGKDFYKFDSRDIDIRKRNMKSKIDIRKPKLLPITLEDLEYIEGTDWNFLVNEIIDNVWCPKCQFTVSIEKYTAQLNDLDDIILHGTCSDCHGSVVRYLETGEVASCLPRIAKVREKLATI